MLCPSLASSSLAGLWLSWVGCSLPSAGVQHLEGLCLLHHLQRASWEVTAVRRELSFLGDEDKAPLKGGLFSVPGE